ncbi:MAG: undecaprenyl/decaprenyl-phosphate alpha-N-acetylglucosaminyl 1-phosphate transferase [Coriobacteriales bacterium]|nr:undecaprenyl/decaprenyl-phosphate alpha-N-acetylglucosaminyl 1-phosphate transferase [Coriobacteriales bacterium]
MTQLLHPLLLLVVAAIGTLATTPLAKQASVRLGALDHPGGRRVHKDLTPRLGGVALFFGLILALTTEIIGESLLGWQGIFNVSSISTESAEHMVSYIGVLIGLCVILAVGFIDDIQHISAKLKLLGQIIAASIIVSSGVVFTELQLPFSTWVLYLGPTNITWLPDGILGYPLSVLYLVSFANIINLIDGIDGLATTVAGIAAIALLVMSALTQQPATVLLAVLAIGVCLGFLPVNLPQAKIFLGDSGALFLGMLLGTLSLFVVMRAPSIKLVTVVLVVVAIPILDTLLAIVRRMRARRPVFSADAEHLHHRMIARFSNKMSLAIVALWMLALSACGVLMFLSPGPVALALLAIAMAASIAAFGWLGMLKR